MKGDNMKISNSKLKLLINFYRVFMDNVDPNYLTDWEHQIKKQFEEFLLTLLRECIAKNIQLEKEIKERQNNG